MGMILDMEKIPSDKPEFWAIQILPERARVKAGRPSTTPLSLLIRRSLGDPASGIPNSLLIKAHHQMGPMYVPALRPVL